MITYAKEIKDGEVVAVASYNYVPQFTADSRMVVITEEEYNALSAEFAERAAAVTTDQISDSEALRIITGEEDTASDTE